MTTNKFINVVENLIFDHRIKVVIFFFIITLLLSYSATQLKIDAGFNKQLPLEHDYIHTLLKYQEDFGGANRIIVALTVEENDIFSPVFFATLRSVTDEIFFIPGIDRATVKSIFTPNVRFIEIVEEGFVGGNVIPAEFTATPANLDQVRNNILKSGIVGRLVAADFSGAIVSAQLLEVDRTSGKQLDYMEVSRLLEKNIRSRYQSDSISIHIIGFAKIVGDIGEGSKHVLLLFFITLLITTILLIIYIRNFMLSIIPIACSLVAVIWQLGLLPLLGFGIDPLSILIPFLIFGIGISHGIQMISAIKSEILNGLNPLQAARKSFRKLIVPGGVALISDIIGFITILIINIEIIQEVAITASLGVAMIIFTNLVLLPVLVSFSSTHFKPKAEQQNHLDSLWHTIAAITKQPYSTITLCLVLLLFGGGIWKAMEISIGDLHRGIPELKADARYNLDSQIITERFAIGVDILSVIAETEAQACIDYQIMNTIDEFSWRVRQLDGIQSVVSLATIAKRINAGWNEGNPKWQVLPRNAQALAQSISGVDTGSGLLNTDCSAMPILIFTTDHRATTINHIIAEIKKIMRQLENENIKFKLAGGNISVIAATNDVVKDAQFPMLLAVYIAIIGLCLLTFRSAIATASIVIPLVLASVLTYSMMSLLDIGLKISTLPVAALGVGIGVDYGIYIYSRLQSLLQDKSLTLQHAYFLTLQQTGKAVVMTGLILTIGVLSWVFSPLKLQADMGLLLSFIFISNMLGAILILPALTGLLLQFKSRHS